MRIAKFILRAADTLVSYLVILSLCIAGVYAAYALWDNSLVYAAVDDVQADMMKLRPALVDDHKPSFEDLLAVNEDVVGWVNLDNTNIDYPVLQGKNNLEYFNKDVYGDFSLAGSIYLDSRNDPNFEDSYSLLYGHHMANSRMFGDLELYKDEDFFKENQSGELITPNGVYELKTFATLIVPANEVEIFNPTIWQDNIEDLIAYTEDRALYIEEDRIGNMKSMGEDLKILALTTCTTEFTDARTVVLAVMEPSSTE